MKPTGFILIIGCLLFWWIASIPNISCGNKNNEHPLNKDSADLVEKYLYDHGKLNPNNVDSAIQKMTRCDSLETVVDSLKRKIIIQLK